MWLALETATDRASVAVGHGFDDAREESLSGARRHAGALIPMIDAALRQRGTSLDRVTGVLLSDGPGSFTGLRVAASTGKALAHARGLPLWTAPSLLVRAAGVARGERCVVVAVSDALRGEVYAGAFRFERGRVTTELAPAVWRPDALVDLGLAPDVLVGEVPDAIGEMLERSLRRPLIGPPDGSAQAGRLIQLAAMDGGARPVEDSHAWEPVYGRPAEAQARWELVHGRPLPDSVGGPR